MNNENYRNLKVIDHGPDLSISIDTYAKEYVVNQEQDVIFHIYNEGTENEVLALHMPFDREPAMRRPQTPQ